MRSCAAARRRSAAITSGRRLIAWVPGWVPISTSEPQEAGKGFEFVDTIKCGVVPREYIPAVEKGVLEALNNGVLLGYPVVDVNVTLTDSADAHLARHHGPRSFPRRVVGGVPVRPLVRKLPRVSQRLPRPGPIQPACSF